MEQKGLTAVLACGKLPAEQSRAEQSRAEQSRAEQAELCTFVLSEDYIFVKRDAVPPRETAAGGVFYFRKTASDVFQDNLNKGKGERT